MSMTCCALGSKSLTAAFDGVIRPNAESGSVERFDHLARQAQDSITRGNTDDAKKSISEMHAIFFEEALKQPGFLVNTFLELARERHFAIDKSLHDRLVEAGKASIERSDLDGLRAVIAQMHGNRHLMDAKDGPTTALAGLMKW